jgi:hypothetical protein
VVLALAADAAPDPCPLPCAAALVVLAFAADAAPDPCPLPAATADVDVSLTVLAPLALP